MLNCRNNGVKDVAYKCYASIMLGGAEGGRRGGGNGERHAEDPSFRIRSETLHSRLLQELAFCAQQLAAIYGGNSFFPNVKKSGWLNDRMGVRRVR